MIAKITLILFWLCLVFYGLKSAEGSCQFLQMLQMVCHSDLTLFHNFGGFSKHFNEADQKSQMICPFI